MTPRETPADIERQPVTYLGLQILVVEPGTVIAKDGSGEDMVVTDESAVFNGNRAWVTQTVYNALKAKVAP